MSALSLVVNAKRAWFEAIRRRRVTRMLQDLDNYLTNVDVRVGLPYQIDRALVLSPHPDDESIGCGGTLALLARQGTTIDVAFMTSGAPAGDAAHAATREEESRQAARALGLATLHFIHGQDGELHLQPWLFKPVAELMTKVRPQIVFCPWPYDGHSDHMATFRIVKEALRHVRPSPELWLYEVWAPVMANRLVAIDAALVAKRTAIECHRSQLVEIDYIDKFLGLSRYRSLNCRPGDHAEAFLVCTPEMIERFGTPAV